VFDRWGYLFDYLQSTEIPTLEFKIKRGGEDVAETFGPIKAGLDRSWPRADPGLVLMPDTKKQQASTLVEAAGMGIDGTLTFIKQIYLNLKSMFTGRISTDSLGGPILIAQMAFTSAGMDWLDFAMFLGFISINLAVVNFLPIPILDGGHMVFLIYEALRGKRPSETVQTVATFIGLAMILSLMVFVFYNDIRRWFWG
jgi:regulator of sigma E protease